jgi:hypothetical protein
MSCSRYLITLPVLYNVQAVPSGILVLHACLVG